MKILFFSDPHLGVDRKANTTEASRAYLRDTVANHLQYQVINGVLEPDEEAFVVCGGDLFDTFSNPEHTLVTTHRILESIDLCLAGNHDVVSNAMEVGSLELMSYLHPGKVIRAEYRQVRFHVKPLPGLSLYMVPHHSSRERFEQALQNALDHRASGKADTKAVLLLHCNFDLPEVNLAFDNAQNLTRGDAEALLDHFDYILLGHEHNPADHFNGRVKIIGNTFPTSFGDLTDKRVLIFDTDVGQFSSVRVWEKSRAIVLDAEQVVAGNMPPIGPLVQYIDIVGNVPAGDVAALNRIIKKNLWQAHASHLIAVRNSSGTLRDTKLVSSAVDQGDAAERLPERVDRALRGTPLYDLWKRLLTARSEEMAE